MSIEIFTFAVTFITLIFVVNDFFIRHAEKIRKQLSEFYTTAALYVVFQETVYREPKKMHDGKLVSHTKTGFFVNIDSCGTELFSKRDALLDLIFKKAAFINLAIVEEAFCYEKAIHADGVVYNDKALISSKLKLCSLIVSKKYALENKILANKILRAILLFSVIIGGMVLYHFFPNFF
jgi:hypothetical protein